MNLETPALFAKIFLAIIHRYTESVFDICTHCNLFANFFLANTSYLYGSPKFPLPKFSLVLYLYLYLNTSKSACILLKYFSQNNAKYLYLYFNKYQSTCTLLKYFYMYFAPCLLHWTVNAQAQIKGPLHRYIHLLDIAKEHQLLVMSFSR